MAEQSNNSEEQKITFRPKRRAKCLRTKRASSDSDEDKIEEDMSTSKMSNKRPAESNTEETPCKRTRTEEVVVCAICKDPDSPEPFTFLLCAHSFHTVCITPWLERSRRCPICRTVVRDSTAHSHDSDSYETDSEPDAIELYLSDSSTTISTSSSSSSFLSTSSTTTMTSESDSDETLSHGDFDEIALWSSSDLYETDWSENNEFLIHCNGINFNASNYTDTDSNEEE